LMIKVGFVGEEGRYVPFSLDLRKYPHILVCGKSGSGKGILILYCINSVLQSNEFALYIGDPKNSGDFEGLADHYSVGEEVANLITAVYERYIQIKKDKTGERILLIVDEYPSFILNLENLDKKKAAVIKNMIAELLMQGRSLPGGGSVAVWLVAQRMDALYLPSGSRMNAMVSVGLGRLDAQSKAMLFPGEELPEYEPTTGTGLILADGYPLRILKVPEIDNLERFRKLLQKKARRRNGGYAEPKPGEGLIT
jgi:hypothetical protein